MCSVSAASMKCTQVFCGFSGFHFNTKSNPGYRISREMEEDEHRFGDLFESLHFKFLVKHVL